MKVELCACGRPFASLESVQGRMEDTLFLPAVTGGKVDVPPLVFNRIMDILPVSGWQVIQEANDSLTVLLSGVRDGLSDEMLVERIGQELASQGVRVPPMTVQHVPAIPKTAAGKSPLIKLLSGPTSYKRRLCRWQTTPQRLLKLPRLLSASSLSEVLFRPKWQPPFKWPMPS